MKARLETSGGDFVIEKELPPFSKAPDVVVWGSRVFKWYRENRGASNFHVFREADFAFTIPQTAGGETR